MHLRTIASKAQRRVDRLQQLSHFKMANVALASRIELAPGLYVVVQVMGTKDCLVLEARMSRWIN